jgi:hypothetical protein
MVPGLNMKLGIVLGVIIGAVVLVAAVLLVTFLGILPLTREIAGKNDDSPNTTYSSSYTTPVPTTSSPVTNPPVSSQATVPVTTTAANTQVAFRLTVTNVSTSGLTGAVVSAQLTNSGTGDSHNTWASLEVFSQGTPIKVNGQGSLRIDLGTIQAGQTIARNVEMDFTLFDGIKISQNGTTLNLTVHSDEATQSISYDYQP